MCDNFYVNDTWTMVVQEQLAVLTMIAVQLKPTLIVLMEIGWGAVAEWSKALKKRK